MTAGRYNMSVGDISDIMDSRYLELFNANGINQIHNVKECEIHCPEMYDFWKDHEICSTLQFMIGSNEHVMGIVSLIYLVLTEESGARMTLIRYI